MNRTTCTALIIAGPTGVGKSNFAEYIADHFSGEIVNGDMGQMYTPLTIGTAKPDWRNERIRHHGFDCIDHPVSQTVIQYRQRIKLLLEDINSRGKMPIIVGGSSFYMNALFFPPKGIVVNADMRTTNNEQKLLLPEEKQALWEKLLRIDPARAAALHPHDVYRVERALMQCEQGDQASLYQPLYDPLVEGLHVLYLTRPRVILYERINDRVHEMLRQGWFEEVLQLDHSWHEFLLHKKLIGYDDLVQEVLQGNLQVSAKTISQIQQRTRNYAKRQGTYWRAWRPRLEALAPGTTHEINLTLPSIDLYLEELMRWIHSRKGLTHV